MNSHEERWLEAEIYRLKGELLLQQAREQATGIGQQLAQKSVANREKMQAKGSDTKDLQEAKALLEALSRH